MPPEHGAPISVDVDGTSIRLSSPDRTMFPGISKRDVLDYYLSVGTVLLDQIGGRPTALERWPDGVTAEAEHFYQKHLPKTYPSYVHGVEVQFPSGRTGTLLDPDSRAAIAWAVQMSTVTFHAWPVRDRDVARPDQLRIDLDPSPANPFDDVRAIARLVREVLDELGFPGFIKTSGGRGLHIFVPILPAHSFIDVRHAAIAIGREVERRAPSVVTMSWWKEERGDRVFIDFNQNAQDRVMASAYSLRPRAEATASLPFDWSDLDGIEPGDCTLRTVPGIVLSRGADPWLGIAEAAVDLAPALAWWDRDAAAGLPELPYPPDFRKMAGEPPRVQPSRARASE